MLNRIVFFWVGSDIVIPSLLVKSILLAYGPDVEIIQTTDQSTPTVDGVNSVVRSVLSPEIMLARLEAYAAVKVLDQLTLFIDADSLLLSRMEVSCPPAKNVFLIRRGKEADGTLNHTYPEYYPEFKGKLASEVMPFMFGALAVRRDESFFSNLLSVCRELPSRFHRWYGDQMSLALCHQKFDADLDSLSQQRHLHVVTKAPLVSDYFDLSFSGVQLITFKGSASKMAIPRAFERLEKFLLLQGFEQQRGA